MGRRKRNLDRPGCYHVTHRCQERRFLLRFEIDRRNYVERLRQMQERYGVDVLNYCVTSNHIHLLVFARRARDLSAGLHFLQGNTSRDYNRRKDRQGSFWQGRYHPTLIETGTHLGRCLFYVDLNMVRAGVVCHPAEWRCGGHQELSGARRRYRLVNIDRLIQCLGHDPEHPEGVERFRAWYEATLEEKLQAEYHAREAFWSEATAVGSKSFVDRFSGVVSGGRVEMVLSLEEADASYALTLTAGAQKSFWARHQDGRTPEEPEKP